MSTRKAAEQEILQGMEGLLPGSKNTQLYKDLFASMNDEQFNQFMQDLVDKKKRLCVIAPNFAKPELDIQRNLNLAKKLGHNFWQRVWVPAQNGQPSYLTPVKYLIVDLPFRRQAQLLEKKISIPEHNNAVDNFTGQVTGVSKGSRISYTETQVLASLGFKDSLVEMLKYRGGDERGFRALNASFNNTGGASLKAMQPYAGKVKATQTLRTFLTAMHYRVEGL